MKDVRILALLASGATYEIPVDVREHPRAQDYYAFETRGPVGFSGTIVSFQVLTGAPNGVGDVILYDSGDLAHPTLVLPADTMTYEVSAMNLRDLMLGEKGVSQKVDEFTEDFQRTLRDLMEQLG